MKKKILLTLSVVMFCVAFAYAQDAPSGLVNAFKKGSAQDLLPFLGNQVEVTIQSRTQNCNRTGAQQAMATFFTSNKVSAFSVNHQGKRDDSGFFVGTLNTSNGPFRVNCFFKKGGNQTLIHQIRIDKTNE